MCALDWAFIRFGVWWSKHLCTRAFFAFVYLGIFAFGHLCTLCTVVHMCICVFVHLCICAVVQLCICVLHFCAFLVHCAFLQFAVLLFSPHAILTSAAALSCLCLPCLVLSVPFRHPPTTQKQTVNTNTCARRKRSLRRLASPTWTSTSYLTSSRTPLSCKISTTTPKPRIQRWSPNWHGAYGRITHAKGKLARKNETKQKQPKANQSTAKQSKSKQDQNKARQKVKLKAKQEQQVCAPSHSRVAC